MYWENLICVETVQYIPHVLSACQHGFDGGARLAVTLINSLLLWAFSHKCENCVAKNTVLQIQIIPPLKKTLLRPLKAGCVSVCKGKFQIRVRSNSQYYLCESVQEIHQQECLRFILLVLSSHPIRASKRWRSRKKSRLKIVNKFSYIKNYTLGEFTGTVFYFGSKKSRFCHFLLVKLSASVVGTP